MINRIGSKAITGQLWVVFERRTEYVLALIVLIISCAAAVALYAYDKNSFVYFGDAASHIVKAREFTDSQHPGIHNIGTVWLPLPHLLLLPIVTIDGLFYTGLAGAVLGIPLLVGTTLLIFLTTRRITQSTPIAFFSACLCAFNPNVLYMSFTPMSEPCFIFFVALAGYWFLIWSETGSLRNLALCSASAALASLCRYEAWPLAPFLCCAVLLRVMEFRRKRIQGRTFATLLLAGVSWLGIIFWFLWNYAHYGNAIEFAQRTYSAGSTIARETLQREPKEVFLLLGKALMLMYGPVILMFGAIAFFLRRSVIVDRHKTGLLLFLAVLPTSTVAAIVAGFVQVDRWMWNWRYVLSFAPLLSVAGAISLSEIFRTVRSRMVRSVVVVSLASMPFVQLLNPSVGVETFKEGQKSFNYGPQYAADLGRALQRSYIGGSVAMLTGYGQGQRVMLVSGIPLKKFHLIASWGKEDLLASLEDSERYVVIGKDRMPESAQLVDYWLARRELLLLYYTVKSEDEHYILLQRLNGDYH